jgi:hypothetical protein
MALTLVLLTPAQAYSRATSILIDELDAGGFKGVANGQVIRCRQSGRSFLQLSAANGGDTQGRGRREVLRRPTNKGAGCSYLGACQGRDPRLTLLISLAIFHIIYFVKCHQIFAQQTSFPSGEEGRSEDVHKIS